MGPNACAGRVSGGELVGQAECGDPGEQWRAIAQARMGERVLDAQPFLSLAASMQSCKPLLPPCCSGWIGAGEKSRNSEANWGLFFLLIAFFGKHITLLCNNILYIGKAVCIFLPLCFLPHVGCIADWQPGMGLAHNTCESVLPSMFLYVFSFISVLMCHTDLSESLVGERVLAKLITTWYTIAMHPPSEPEGSDIQGGSIAVARSQSHSSVGSRGPLSQGPGPAQTGSPKRR